MEAVMGWMGLEECGCLSLLVSDAPHALEDCAKDVRSLKRRKGTFTRHPIEECRARAWYCTGHAIAEQEKAAREAARTAVAS